MPTENIAVLGVVTPALRKELNQMRIADFLDCLDIPQAPFDPIVHQTRFRLVGEPRRSSFILLPVEIFCVVTVADLA